MSAPRFDLYTLVHKGQRHKLFRLTLAAGRISADDRAGREALAQEIATTLSSLVEHAEGEEMFFGPLYREAAPALGERLAAEHGALEQELARVRGAVAAALAEATAAADLALYRALARLTSAYLAHVEIEEGSMPALWARFDDAALGRAQSAVVAAHSRATVQFNLKHMLPAASPAERVSFLSNLRRQLPPPAFAGVRELVGALVPASEWAHIDAA
jgi:hypothetical protein